MLAAAGLLCFVGRAPESAERLGAERNLAMALLARENGAATEPSMRTAKACVERWKAAIRAVGAVVYSERWQAAIGARAEAAHSERWKAAIGAVEVAASAERWIVAVASRWAAALGRSHLREVSRAQRQSTYAAE